MSTTTSPTPQWHPLSGGTAVWVFMTVEVVTFGMFLMWHAASWHTDPEGFSAAQHHLDLGSGVLGTIILLTGSWFAYNGVLANAQGRSTSTARWLAAGSVAGLAFSLNKMAEWIPHFADGIGLSSGGFWFSYLFLTQMHLLHVLPGSVVLAVLAWRTHRGAYGPQNALPIESGAAFWHLVDVVWILLFSILYVMHP